MAELSRQLSPRTNTVEATVDVQVIVSRTYVQCASNVDVQKLSPQISGIDSAL